MKPSRLAEGVLEIDLPAIDRVLILVDRGNHREIGKGITGLASDRAVGRIDSREPALFARIQSYSSPEVADAPNAARASSAYAPWPGCGKSNRVSLNSAKLMKFSTSLVK